MQPMNNTLMRAHNIADLRTVARARLPKPMFDYIDGGADDEQTLRHNRDAFARWHLIPRYLIDVSRVDTRTRVLGHDIEWPVILAPTGMSRLFHHEGERAVCRAAAAAGTLYTLSSMGSVDIEEIGKTSAGAKCFQIYAFRDRDLTREFIERARTAGYGALCLTVDMPVAGNRERDHRSGMTIPPQITFTSLLGILSRPRWCWKFATTPRLQLANVAHRIAAGNRNVTSLMTYINDQFDASVTWDTAALMVREWQGPFAIKGIVSAEDARRAVEIGATAIVVSNHGGRQLDGAPGALDVLPQIAAAVGGRAEIILDGGVRRGTDVLKALALGADACMIGRPYLYGLAAGGEAGVARALTLLRREIERAMALVGARTIDEIGRHLVMPACR
jgi:L-lactate dehydrogenase (cytochrome)